MMHPLRANVVQLFQFQWGIMKITVVGTGHVGLVSGACLAEVGNDVLCLGLDVEEIQILETGTTLTAYDPVAIGR